MSYVVCVNEVLSVASLSPDAVKVSALITYAFSTSDPQDYTEGETEAVCVTDSLTIEECDDLTDVAYILNSHSIEWRSTII